jgi:branched-chain amino acid transport system permease protein
MKKILAKIFETIGKNTLLQYALLAAYIVLSTLWVYSSRDSVFGFVVFIGTVLAVYYAKIPQKAKLGFGILILGFLIPFIGMNNLYYLDVTTQILIYIALALGLNIVVGFSGLFNLGYAAFYAVGAYLWAEFGSSQASNWISWAQFPLNGNWFWIFILLGITVTALVGVLLGLPVLKVKGDYLALVTLGFAEIVRLMFNNLDKPINFTNGPKGITSIQPPAILGMKLDAPIDYYFIALLMILLIVIVTKRLEHSRIGRSWAAIRDDEVAAKAMGVEIVKTKLLAFAYGAAFAGAMGVIFAAKQTYVDPTSFTFMESFMILAMVILGGIGSVPGAIVGATALVVLQLQLLKGLSDFCNQLRVSGILNLPSQLEPAKYERFVLGILMVLMMLFRPQGIIPAEESHITIDEEEESEPGMGLTAGDTVKAGN